MDPTEALNRIREGVKDYYSDDWSAGQGDELVQDLQNLDEWMSKGGFPPDQWVTHITRGRPRRTQDGFVLDSVEHGTRSSYNKGCRCLKCTEANRAAGALHRSRKEA